MDLGQTLRKYYSPDSLEDAHIRALEVEKYSRNPVVHRTNYQEPRLTRSMIRVGIHRNDKASISNPHLTATNSMIPRPRDSSTETRESCIQCHNCQQQGHIASRCTHVPVT